jgi:hypothetical protein
MTQTALERARTQDGSELGALAELMADGFGGAVTRVQELHEAIADRVFGMGGPTSAASAAASAPRAVHDAIAGSVYAAVREAGTLLGAGAARTVRAAGGGPRISDHPRGRLAQGALNGVWGDRLQDAGSPLAVPMAVRMHGRDVAADRDAIAAAFPTATAHPVVFVHGLCESDAAWSIRAAEHGGTYATRVLPEVEGTPVTIRYNTGLRISENGRRLAALLEALVDAWPVPIERLALVGHSMGGLVIRSAGHAATEGGHRWPALVDTTISLGTPHLGAPLAQAAHLATWALDAVPESRPIAAVLRARSAGIKDLRHGSLVDAEWETLDPDALRGFERADVPLLERARHHVVAATLTGSPDHPLARIVGDLLVLSPSAHGLQGRRRIVAFDDDSCRHVGGHGHFDLLNSPALDGLLREWLAPPAPAGRLSGR